MHIPLVIHLSIHFILAVLAGFLVGKHYHKINVGVIAGIMGGFLIDLDHVLEYFFTFGLRFNFTYFFQGRQFLLSNRTLSIFHAWEYIPVMIIIIYIFRRRQTLKVFLMALTLGATVHLISDCFLNNYPARNYSIIYRASKGFNSSLMLDADQLRFNNQLKQDLGI